MSAGPGHLVVVGLMGAGKTTVGRALARALGLPFVDNDVVLEAEQHHTAAALARDRGVEALHAAEAEAARASLAAPTTSVVALPASGADNAGILALLRPHHVVWLRASPATLRRRVVGSGERRPSTDSLHTTFDEQARRRAKAFAEVADQIVDVDGRTPDQVVAEVERQLPRDFIASDGRPTDPGQERGSAPS